MFIFSLTPVIIILLSIAFVAIILSICYGLRGYIRAAKFENPPVPDYQSLSAIPKATVLVYCQSDDDTLLSMLEAVEAQDYPDFEVVVVCDAALDYSEMVAEKIATRFSDVYVTFVQPGSHNLSRRKLAITIGMKAAKGEVVVTTCANASIPSTGWLSAIMAPFASPGGEHIDLSLGVSKMDFFEMRGPGKWYRQFDALLTNALWIGYAANYKAYRGDGYNMAIRRNAFFDNKGFARTINLHNGDDDLFVNEIATSANTRVVASPDSIVTTRWGESSRRVWSIRKERYSFTARWLPHAPFVRSAVQQLCQWILPGACGAASFIAFPNIFPAAIAVVLLLIFWGVEIYWYRRLAARLGAVRLFWAVPIFWLIRPIADLMFRYDHLQSRKKNFTWQR